MRLRCEGTSRSTHARSEAERDEAEGREERERAAEEREQKERGGEAHELEALLRLALEPLGRHVRAPDEVARGRAVRTRMPHAFDAHGTPVVRARGELDDPLRT